MGQLRRHHFGLCCGLVMCCAWQSVRKTEQTAPKTDLTTPSKTIQSFLAAINSHNDLAASTCVVGGKPSASLHALQRLDNLVYYHVDSVVLSCRDMEVQLNGESATVKLKFTMADQIDGREFKKFGEVGEGVELKREAMEWKIEPADLAEIQTLITKPDEAKPGRFIMQTAAAYANPDIFAESRRRAVGVNCRQHMKILCTLALEYLQDHDEVYSFTPAGYRKSLIPYYVKLQHEMATRIKVGAPMIEAETRREVDFHCPLDLKGETGFAFNANLYKLADPAITDPARTVLFYEGKNGKLEFRHGGKANVGFADGHVETVDSVAAKRLVWLPYPGFHPKP